MVIFRSTALRAHHRSRRRLGDDFYQSLKNGDPDAWTFQDDLNDLVIEKGYHRTPLLADFALFDIGDSGDDDLRDHLIEWGFAHHPHINPAPDDRFIGGDFDRDEDYDGGDFVSQYAFLTSFTGNDARRSDRTT